MGIKFKVNEKFFDTWSPCMAYVLGFIYADGSLTLSARGKYITISSTDKFIIERIKSWLTSDHAVINTGPTSLRGKDNFRLRIGNARIYDSLVSRGLYPNKSLTIQMPRIPKEFLGDFIRGYFDGDGCVYVEQGKGVGQKEILKRLTTVFTSGSKSFLQGLLKTINKAEGLRQGKIYNSHNSFQLRLGTQDSVKLFCLMYEETSLEMLFDRKLKRFKEYFTRRPSRVDERVRSILQSLSPSATW